MNSASIVLTAINARYSHASLGARFLLENAPREVAERTRFMEFSIRDRPTEMAAVILRNQPAIVGLGVYIWNRLQVETLVARLREARPELCIVLGGPEISHDTESALGREADCIVRGEGEVLWPAVCRALLAGEKAPRLPEPIKPDLGALRLPEASYDAHDLHHRNISVEASRGCPLACDFCLSSIERGVRHFSEAAVFETLERLLNRGARGVRFIDRSFNLGGRRAENVLAFLLRHLQPGRRFHFEMTPDGLTLSLRSLLTRFPPGVLHIETGVQSFVPEVLEAVHRRCDPDAVAEGIGWLVSTARATVHADLIAGLPGETLESFAAGFDRLYRLGPSEIQVGILKQLHGTPLRTAAADWGLRFQNEPPYAVMGTPTMSDAALMTVHRFASHWGRVVNRGLFPRSTAVMLLGAVSPWQRFDAFSRILATQHGLTGIGLVTIAEALAAFLVSHVGLSGGDARRYVREDYLDGGRRINVPRSLRD